MLLEILLYFITAAVIIWTLVSYGLGWWTLAYVALSLVAGYLAADLAHRAWFGW